MPLLGPRSRFVFTLAAILIVAMLLIDVVLLATAQKLQLRSESDRGRLALELIQKALSEPIAGERFEATAGYRHRFEDAVRATGADCAVFSGDAQEDVFRSGSTCRSADVLDRMARRAGRTGTADRHSSGTTWAVFWHAPRELMLSAPIMNRRLPGAGVALAFDLNRIYAPLRTSQKILFIFIALNTLVLGLVGFYRISRLYLEPVTRMAQRAHKYREDSDLPFALQKQDNELKTLSIALNQMLHRIAQDKKTLRDMVESLKNANLDLQRAQADVIRAEKLSTVGRLASGVAHEIGNPLGIVLGYLELLNRNDTADAERRDYIERSVVEIKRIGAIIQQLLDFSRPAKGVPTMVSAHTVMAEVAEMLSVQPIFAGIDFHLQLSAGCDSVFADRDQIKQVLINLALNAADAVAAKGCGRQGRIVMSSELTPSKAGAVSPPADREAPRFFSIRCADNGTGIPEDQLSCVFDPFFTTKEPQRGTGLGLAVSYMIVENMGGRLEAESAPGEGTTMSLYLPLHLDG